MIAGHHDDLDSGLVALRIAPGTSARGGSSRPTSPRKTRSLLESSSCAKRAGSFLDAKARTRSPCSAIPSCARDDRSRVAASSDRSMPVVKNAVAQRQHRFERSLAVEHGAFGQCRERRIGASDRCRTEISSRRRQAGDPATAPCEPFRPMRPPSGRRGARRLPSRLEYFTSWQRLAHMKKSRWRWASSALPLHLGGIEWRSSAEQQFANPHAVLGERAGLVGTDDRRRTERLDGRQVADQDVALRHALGGEHEREGQVGSRPSGTMATMMPIAKNEVLPERHAD